MWTLIRNGGVPMLFILLFGLVGLGAAFYFALRAQRRILGFIESLAMATLFATLAATCADVGATLYAAEKAFDGATTAETRQGPAPGEPTDKEHLPRALHVVIEGCAESTSPGILGFSLLALTWMLVAVGRRRMDERAGVV